MEKTLSTAALPSRILALLDRTSSSHGCWLWCGSCNQDGYGVVEHEGRQVKAHRLVFELVTGRKIEGGLVLRHQCEEHHRGIEGRRCCFPGHLVPGTRAQNAADRHQKGRSPRQERKSPGAPAGRRWW